MNEEKLETFMGSVLGDMGGAMTILMVSLGDELGLYDALDGEGFMSPAVLALRTGCNERLLQEWLDQQTTAGYLEHGDGAYRLPGEHAMALARRESPVFVASGMLSIVSMYEDLGRVAAAFRRDGGLAWGDHSPNLFKGVAEFFRPGYLGHLTTDWIPALDGVDDALTSGGRVADVGCGHGISSLAIADAYPESTVIGYDLHGPSIEEASAAVQAQGLVGRVSFEVASAQEFTGDFDLICFFDCLHDMGDPVGIARHARWQLTEGGSVMLVEPFAHSDKATNLASPVAKIFYGASTCVCTPSSLSQDGRRAMGAQAGEPAMRAVFDEAGYSQFRRVTETPFNIVYQAVP